MAPAETLEFLTVRDRKLFVARLQPEGRPRGALLCLPPFADEKKNAHRLYAEFCRLLAGRGYASLRLDLTGSGDSDGDLDDATLDVWIEDAAAAFESLDDAAPRFLLGLRLGATLAARFAAGRPDVAGIVLWQPVVNGRRAFAADLRRTLIKQMMTDGASRVTRQELLAQLEEGEGRLDLDGFPFTGALYRGIASLDLLADEAPFPGPTRVVQISHADDLQGEVAQLARSLEQRGVPVTAEAVVAPPLWARIERVECPELFAGAAAWIEEAPTP